MNGARNIHATAIVAGTRGLLFTGPSGAGKSRLAFSCLVACRSRGAFGALVADDQVFIQLSGDTVIACRPPATAGLLEIRGTGIAAIGSIEKARIDLAIQVVEAAGSERLPPEDERFEVLSDAFLPMIRMTSECVDPLAVIAAMRPEFKRERPFS